MGTGVHNAALFLFFVAFIQIALLNVVTGVFVESAMSHATPDREAAVLAARKDEKELAKRLKQIVTEFDTDCSGTIEPHEFLQANSQAGVQLRHYLASLGIDLHDAEMFFQVMGSAT